MKMDPPASALNRRRTDPKHQAMACRPANDFPGDGRKGRSPDLAQQALRQFLLEMVSLVFGVGLGPLSAPTRGRQKTAFARQVAMYLAHTGGGLSLSCVGRLFGRDRTTVAHACALVEDARDEVKFDRTLTYMESAIECQMDLFHLSRQDNSADHFGAEQGHQL